MAKTIEVSHKGVTINILEDATTVNGKEYRTYTIRQYVGDKLIRHKRSNLEEAKKLAREIAEAREMVPLSGLTREVQNTLEALAPTGTRMDAAARVYAEACALVGVDQIIEACRYWKENRPAGKFMPKAISEAADEFLASKAARTSERRQRTNRSYLNTFEGFFPGMSLHEVQTAALEDKVNAKPWAPKTKNDFLGLVSYFYKWGMKRGYAAVNPASPEVIEREDKLNHDIGIFTPSEARKILTDISPELVPFTALWLFTGLRQVEIARLTWPEVEQGMQSGRIFLPESKSKTRARSVPVTDNLKLWLLAYRQPTGPVLPQEWQGIDRLSELAQTISRQSKVPWKANAPRHSFATYSLALHKNAPELVKQMGNSLRQLESHYWDRSKCITPEQAREWFNIRPASNVIPMPSEAPAEAVVGNV